MRILKELKDLNVNNVSEEKLKIPYEQLYIMIENENNGDNYYENDIIFFECKLLRALKLGNNKAEELYVKIKES